jgi:hypothetical protein
VKQSDGSSDDFAIKTAVMATNIAMSDVIRNLPFSMIFSIIG